MSRRKFSRAFIPLFFAAIVLLGSIFYLPAYVWAENMMPDFSLVSVEDGTVIDSKNLKGKVLLINFFATWCPPCRQEIPDLIEFQEKYGDQGFSVIGISTDQGGPELLKKFIKKMKINYPIVLAAAETPHDFGNIIGIPTNFLINRSGKIVSRYDGYVDHELLGKSIKALLAEK